jgi:iron complex outermembrane receptor protein
MNSQVALAVGRSVRPWIFGSLMVLGSVAANAAQPAADEGDDLEEVVVTAQFREQRLQDTPIAITAVTAETLEARNQTSLAAVAEQAPNVVLTETGGAFGPGLSARIRGIGQGDYIAALEPGVGIYIDDVYYSSLTGANFDLIDLARVEILRGPQGTLAGRNSEGGAVKMYSQKPTGSNTGSVRAVYGSRSLADVRAVGDFTVVPGSLFARVSGVSRKQDGYVTIRDYGCDFPESGIPSRTQHADCVMGHEGGKDYSATRMALRWVASENVEVNFSSDLMVDNSESAANVLIATGPVFQSAELLGNVPFGSQYIPADPFVSYASFTGFRLGDEEEGVPDTLLFFAPTTKTKVWGTNLTVDWNLSDSLALKSITAYREFDSRWTEDNDASPAYLGLGAEHQSNESFSQELRLTGKAGEAFDFSFGAYYFDQTTIGRTHQVLNYVPTPFLFEFLGNDPTKASSHALFVNGSWHATDALNVNAGVRYTKEKKDYTYSRLNPDGTPNILLGAFTGETGSYSGSEIDYRFNVDYRWNDRVMTYASVSTGFKGGGTNPRPFNDEQVLTFDPETLTAYEIGAKSDWLDRRLRVNVSVFLNKFKDVQVTLLECPVPTPEKRSPCALPANAGNADIKGAELEVEWHPVAGMTLDASLSKLDFEYTSFTADAGIPVGATAPGTIEDKFSIGAQYEVTLAGGATITPRVDYSHQGGFNTNAVPTAGNRVGGRGLANARVTWRPADGDWEVSAVATNLTDKRYYHSVFDLTALGGGSNTGMPGAPREFSLQVQKKF